MEPPVPPMPQTEDEQAANHAAEKACGEKISYWLEKFGCDLQAMATLSNGQVRMRIDIVKIPPDVLRQIKKAKANGQSGPGFAETSA
jgi:EAL domain-containing protein (putative c-di-GMP-specific phosphodiesterase class I)